KGISEEGYVNVLSREVVTELKDKNILRPAIHNPELLQPDALNREVFDSMVGNLQLSPDQLEKCWKTFINQPLTDPEITALVSSHYPEFSDLAKVWDEAWLSTLQVTTVGLVIGYSHITRVTTFKADLGIWFPE
ncbi:MAG: hypothetical protein AAF202_11745, partial [Pseudomonadota bacterium]